MSTINFPSVNNDNKKTEKRQDVFIYLNQHNQCSCYDEHQPVKDLIVSFSLNTKYENTIDTTMLSLSIALRHSQVRPAVPCNNKAMSACCKSRKADKAKLFFLYMLYGVLFSCGKYHYPSHNKHHYRPIAVPR